MLKLYYADYCPFCRRVIDNFDQMGVKYQLVDAAPDTAGREELLSLGGKAQVPFLVDPDRDIQMYESADIIEYAKQHYAA
jgi:glutathione S-transferase